MWVGVRALRMFNLGTSVSRYFHFQVALRAGLESLEPIQQENAWVL